MRVDDEDRRTCRTSERGRLELLEDAEHAALVVDAEETARERLLVVGTDLCTTIARDDVVDETVALLITSWQSVLLYSQTPPKTTTLR